MVHQLQELDGFWVDRQLARTLHIGWEDEETIYLDLFDSDKSAYAAEGNQCLSSMMLNLRTGEVSLQSPKNQKGDDEAGKVV